MSTPKCPCCGKSDHVHLLSTFAKAGTVVGAVGGAAGTLGGAAGGAAAGAAVCSVVPVIGTAIGAIGGGIIGALTGATAGGAGFSMAQTELTWNQTISEWLAATLYKDGVPSSEGFQRIAWNCKNATSEQLPRKLKPNAFGLYDCFGNVREWAVGNSYSWFGYRKLEDGDSNRVVALGGCWRDDYDDSINWLRKSEPAFSGMGGDVTGIRLLGISCETRESDFVARHSKVGR